MKLGMIKPWPAPANGVVDHGRAATTKNPADDMMFRSAPLRNVVKTAPYSVDGSVPALETMAKLMARHQLAKEMSDADAASIGVFLVALTGTAPRALIAKPLDMK